jgi:hypothetical protein
MATRNMLHERNRQERVIKLGVQQLTMQGALSRLGSTKLGFWLRPLRRWLFAALMVAGCATVPSAGLSKESPPDVKRAVLKERINERWNALIRGDLDQAYTFLSAASKEAYPLSVYKSKVKPGMWRSVAIDGIECEAEICKATLTLTYDHRLMKGISTQLLEIWTIDNGNAWFVYQPAG